MKIHICYDMVENAITVYTIQTFWNTYYPIYLRAKNITTTASYRANYLNITDNAVCYVIIVTETFTSPDSMSYFVILT